MGSYGQQHLDGDVQLPPGFRFHPTDEEVITYYLLKKVLDSSFTGRAIAEVDLNKCEPWELPGKAKMGEKEWYFFCLRDRKYPTGLRTNRATGAGYWKATGKDREIASSKTGALLGMKKTLVFYKGRAPKGEKSDWVMHEFRLEGKFAYHFISMSSMDEWVVVRVFQKTGGSNSKKSNAGVDAASGSQSSSSLPRLLETLAGGAADRESCSLESSEREYVPCFSNATAPMMNFGHPTLRSLQESLQLPLFLSSLSPPAPPCDAEQQRGAAGMWPFDLDRKTGAGRPQCELPIGATELDWLFG